MYIYRKEGAREGKGGGERERERERESETQPLWKQAADVEGEGKNERNDHLRSCCHQDCQASSAEREGVVGKGCAPKGSM